MRIQSPAAACALAVLGGCASTPPAPAIAQAPKNIILFVGSGMGITTLTAARVFAVGETGELAIDRLPESAFVKTWSKDRQVGDDAAAMTAIMAGVKAGNGVLSMRDCASGQPAPTLLELAKARGFAAGLVTTIRVDDPAAAAAYSHGCAPAPATAAAALLPGGAGYNAVLGDGIDVLMGGGLDAFDLASLARMGSAGYTVARTPAQLAHAGRRIVGLFAPGDMHYEALRDPAAQPSLAQMTASAIDALAQQPRGFLLVVEGGLIDRAAHATLGRRVLEETVALDRALQTAIDKMRALDPGLRNTLIVATADHDSTLLLNGYARRTGPTTAAEAGVLGLVHVVEGGKPRLDKDGAPIGIIGFGNGEHRVNGSRAAAPALTDEVARSADYHQEATIRTAPGASSHGVTDVFLGATGAGAERFRGTIDNTRIFELIKAVAQW